MRYYSCDSHVVEPASVFDGLEREFGSRAPRIESVPDQGEFIVLPKAGRIPVGRLGIAGHRLDDPATDALIARGYAGLNPGVLDPAARLDEQLVDGIVGEVMYPSLNMFSFAGLDVDVAASVFANHNDYIVDYCSVAPDRLVGIGCLPIPDVDAAIAEMQRAARPRRARLHGARPRRPGAAVPPPRLRPLLGVAAGDRRAADDAHLHRHGLAHRPRRALGTAGVDDQGLHAGPHVGGQHRHRPHLRRRVRALPRRARRRVGVRDRLGVALPAAPRPRRSTAHRSTRSTT